jgi:pyrroline-5-carboxylate reductase
MSVKLGMIGGGVMGEAILSRLIFASLFSPQEILVSDPQAKRRDYLGQTYGVAVCAGNQAPAEATEGVILAIKPQIVGQVAAELAEPKDRDKNSQSGCLISILAGVTLSTLETLFPERAVIRVMPNTPATVGAGMSAIALGSKVSDRQATLARSIFAAVGEVVELPEPLLDAVTGLSGSGPAFVAIFIEALADGGVAAGLPRAIAQQLALQTVWGTAELMRQTQLHPAILKDRVTSPGGTTIAGVAALEQANFRSATIEAVKAACRRSTELG